MDARRKSDTGDRKGLCERIAYCAGLDRPIMLDPNEVRLLNDILTESRITALHMLNVIQ